MNKNDHIDAAVKKTIEVLDKLPEVEAHHLFRARVMERISHEALMRSRDANSAMQGLKLALIAFLLIINIGSALLLMLPDGKEQLFSKNDMLESLTNDYSSPALSYYLDSDGIEETNEHNEVYGK